MIFIRPFGDGGLAHEALSASGRPKPGGSPEREGTLEEKPIFWHYPHYNQHPQSAPHSVIRSGSWKLMEFLETGKIELYDLAEDLGESKDLSQTKENSQGIAHTSPCLEERGPGEPCFPTPLSKKAKKRTEPSRSNHETNPSASLFQFFCLSCFPLSPCRRPSSRQGKTGTEFTSSRRGQSGQWGSARFLRGPARGTQARLIWFSSGPRTGANPAVLSRSFRKVPIS